jgi:putative sterol carrier protein
VRAIVIHTVEEAVKRMEAGFWRRYHANPELQKKLAGKTRIIQLTVPDAESYWFHIHEGKLKEVQPGAHPAPDAVVTASKRDLLAVFNGETKAMAAFLSGRVRVKASFSDMLFAKSLLG